MPYSNLKDFISKLEQENELHRISANVSPELEITEIVDRISKSKGKALLFENVSGSNYPILINAFGSEKRMQLALNSKDFYSIGKQLADMLKPKPTKKVSLISAFKLFKKIKSFSPQLVSNAYSQQIVEENPSFNSLPILKCWPKDGGKYITLPLVITKDPESGERNVGMYRIQILEDKKAIMHWQTHKHGNAHFKKAVKLGKKLEIAIVLGSDPATIFSGVAPLPDGFDELAFAGFIKNSPTKIVKCKSIDLEVPANAEFVLEGYVNPDEFLPEGPFGDHFGHYSTTNACPVFRLTAITRCKNPIYPATIVGKPPMEDCFIGKAIEKMFLPLLQFQFPEIIDYNMPIEAGFHNLCIVSIKSRFPKQAKKVICGLWGLGQMALTKNIIVVNENINPHSKDEVINAVTNNVDFNKDIIFINETVTDSLDLASPKLDIGSKLGIDATNEKQQVENSNICTPLNFDDSSITNFKCYGKIGLFTINKQKPFHAKEIIQKAFAADLDNNLKFIFILDKEINLDNESEVLWAASTRFDPVRDVVFNSIDLNNSVLPKYGSSMGVDCTVKWPEEGFERKWQEEIFMAKEIKDLVNKKWEEYGFGD